jgi:glycosyltransferase involved in cell wall biosynthesis
MITKTPAEVGRAGAKYLSSSPAFDQICRNVSMKLLVFAHTPPPHHGQSYMVKLMLDGFGGDCRRQMERSPDSHGIECYHVNARFSKTLEDVGEFHGTKIFLILIYCLQALWCRFRHGVTNLYYVPAPGKSVAVYRDWLVMLICRPFFKNIILHWHAAGLAKWLETSVQIRSRAITYRVFKPVDLSIVLSRYNVADAEKLLSRRVRVVGNGIPDPCPDFVEMVLPRRQSRLAMRKNLSTGGLLPLHDFEKNGEDPRVIKVLYLAHCTREKGLFDTLDAVALANANLSRSGSPVQVRLTVAGEFIHVSEQAEFEARIVRPDLQGGDDPTAKCCVTYLGFAGGERKRQAFVESDIFCFPTYYHAESFGLVVVEAMAFGLPVVTTRWRSIPEILPPDYAGLVDPKSPEQIAEALVRLAVCNLAEPLREFFLRRFTLEQYLGGLATAIRGVEDP